MATDTPMMESADREPDGGYDTPEQVADATMAAIEAGDVRVIRGGEQRYKMMVKTVEDPVAVEDELLPKKDAMEEATKDHSSL